VIYVPSLKRNCLSVSTIEDIGFFFTFQRGKVLILPKKDSRDNIVVVRVREGTLYRL
jgi:hypothetical protein